MGSGEVSGAEDARREGPGGDGRPVSSASFPGRVADASDVATVRSPDWLESSTEREPEASDTSGTSLREATFAHDAETRLESNPPAPGLETVVFGPPPGFQLEFSCPCCEAPLQAYEEEGSIAVQTLGPARRNPLEESASKPPSEPRQQAALVSWDDSATGESAAGEAPASETGERQASVDALVEVEPDPRQLSPSERGLPSEARATAEPSAGSHAGASGGSVHASAAEGVGRPAAGLVSREVEVLRDPADRREKVAETAASSSAGPQAGAPGDVSFHSRELQRWDGRARDYRSKIPTSLRPSSADEPRRADVSPRRPAPAVTARGIAMDPPAAADAPSAAPNDEELPVPDYASIQAAPPVTSFQHGDVWRPSESATDPDTAESATASVFLNKIAPTRRREAVALMTTTLGLEPAAAEQLAGRLMIPVARDVSPKEAQRILDTFAKAGFGGRIRTGH